MNLILFLFCIIQYTNSANRQHIENQFLIVPYPQYVSANFSSNNSLMIKSSISYEVITNNCNNSCNDFLKNNFNHSIITTLKNQLGIMNYRISLYKELDFKQITPNYIGNLTKIKIKINADEKTAYPYYKIGLNESYEINLNEDVMQISAENVYGIRLGFETLAQLIKIKEDSDDEFFIPHLPIQIKDYPRFKWRGLMIDASRNFIPPNLFIRIVDSLAMLKSNILHIHLSDGQKIVFESKIFPEIVKGAYNSKRVLTQEFVRKLGEYGRLRGVVVYGEIDLPGHTGALGAGYPGVVSDSFSNDVYGVYGENNLAINPANNLTFPLIDALLKEVGETFGNDYVHIGGDELSTSAWSNSKDKKAISNWMKEHQIPGYSELESYFNKYAQESVRKNNKTVVAFQELFFKKTSHIDSIVHIWNSNGMIINAARQGFKVIYSGGFYLDVQDPGGKPETNLGAPYLFYFMSDTFRGFYNNDPTYSFDDKVLENVLGGEGCSWNESCDEENQYDRAFTRFFAIAERFWSDKDLKDADSLEVRSGYVRCLGLRRKILQGTGPLYHNFCDQQE